MPLLHDSLLTRRQLRHHDLNQPCRRDLAILSKTFDDLVPWRRGTSDQPDKSHQALEIKSPVYNHRHQRALLMLTLSFPHITPPSYHSLFRFSFLRKRPPPSIIFCTTNWIICILCFLEFDIVYWDSIVSIRARNRILPSWRKQSYATQQSWMCIMITYIE